MSYLPIVPAFIPKSEKEVMDMADKLKFAAEIQLDLVDGKFAPTVSWPYDPVGNPMAVKHRLDEFTLEVDLMVEEPIKAAIEWEKAGADMLVFHIETLAVAELTAFYHRSQASIGVSAHGDTSLEELDTYLAVADYVQLMGIKEIGAQGNPFDEAVLDKIAWLRSKYPKLSIAVDGSVNQTTIKKIKAAGADRFVSGSAIVKAADPEAAYRELGELIN